MRPASHMPLAAMTMQGPGCAVIALDSSLSEM